MRSKGYYGFFEGEHNMDACNAMCEYEANAIQYDKPGVPTYLPEGESMYDYARKYHTTIDEMKEHRHCAELKIKAQQDGVN